MFQSLHNLSGVYPDTCQTSAGAQDAPITAEMAAVGTAATTEMAVTTAMPVSEVPMMECTATDTYLVYPNVEESCGAECMLTGPMMCVPASTNSTAMCVLHTIVGP